MPEIREFDFGKDEIKITLGEDRGFITLDRNEGVLTFETKLKKLDIRLVEGAKFFLGEAAGYTGYLYVRLEMPPGYGPIRSLGRVKKGSQDGKLFVDVANICVPQSQPVLRSEADVPPRRRAVMRSALGVLLLGLAIGIFCYWISYRDAVRRRANLTAEATAAYNRYHESLAFVSPFYDKPGSKAGNYADLFGAPPGEEVREKLRQDQSNYITSQLMGGEFGIVNEEQAIEFVEGFVSIVLHRGRPTNKEVFYPITPEKGNWIVDVTGWYSDRLLKGGDYTRVRDAALALVVFGQDGLIRSEWWQATDIQRAGLDNLGLCIKGVDDRELLKTTLSYIEVLSGKQLSLSQIVYARRLSAEVIFARFAEPLGLVEKPTGISLEPKNYNLMDFVRDWENYRKTMMEIEAVLRKPVSEIEKQISGLKSKFDSIPEFFGYQTFMPEISVETIKPVDFESVKSIIRQRLDQLR